MVTLGDLGNKKWLTLERRTERSPKKQEKRVTLKTRNKGLPWKQEIKDYICKKKLRVTFFTRNKRFGIKNQI